MKCKFCLGTGGNIQFCTGYTIAGLHITITEECGRCDGTGLVDDRRDAILPVIRCDLRSEMTIAN